MTNHDVLCPLHGQCRLGVELHATVQFCADCETQCMCEWVRRIRDDERRKVWLDVKLCDLAVIGGDERTYPSTPSDYERHFDRLLVTMRQVAEVCRVRP